MSMTNKFILGIVLLISLIISGCSANIDIVPQNTRNNEIFFRYEYWDIDDNQIELDNEKDKIIPVIESINLEDVNQTIPITKFINEGNVIDIYSNSNIIMKIKLVEVMSGKDALISINNQEPREYREGTVIRIKDSYMAKIVDVIFSEDKLKTGILVNVYSEIEESYPNILIENNLGLHRHTASRKEVFRNSDNTTKDMYVAEYGRAFVEVIKNVKFSSLYQDSRNVIDYMDNRIYLIENREKVAWVSFLENNEYVIRIGGYYDSIIKAYLEKYPSHISRKTFCDKDVFLEEGDSWVEYYNEQEFTFRLENIDLANMEVTILINNEEEIMSHKDHLNFNNTIIILDDIEIDNNGKHRVKVCFS